jgi:hypothetical protein
MKNDYTKLIRKLHLRKGHDYIIMFPENDASIKYLVQLDVFLRREFDNYKNGKIVLMQTSNPKHIKVIEKEK